MFTLTRQDLVLGLRSLGLNAGDNVLVHSSLSSFGYVEGGAETVIDALLDVVTSTGTVIVPTLTGNETLSVENPPVFDVKETSAWTGVIPETLRKRSEAVRSLHPTHSVAAIGKNAHLLTQGHQYSVTPCDESSPYGCLALHPDSYILLIGVDHQSSTMFHYIEEVVGVEYHMQEGFVKSSIIIDGTVSHRHIMLHKYGQERNFNIMEPIFIEQGIQKSIMLGKSTVRLIEINGMVRTTVRCLSVDRKILCK